METKKTSNKFSPDVRARAVRLVHEHQPDYPSQFGDRRAPCLQDKVNRALVADRPNRLWVADVAYVATWAGFVYVAFVIDVFARRIVGWRVFCPAKTSFVPDALEQAPCD